MTQRAYNILRLKTALRQFQEMHERTGSVWQATRFFVRFVAAKTPLLLRQAVQTTRRGSVLSDIDAARAAAGTDTPFLGLRVSGGLGDYLTIARFVRDLSRFGGGFTFDIYCTDPARAKWVFSGVPGLRSCYDDILFDAAMPKYDLAAWIGQFIIFFEDVAKWDRLRARPDLAQAARNAIRYRPKIELFIKNHPQLDGFLAQKAIYSNASRANYLHHIAGIPYGGDRFDIDLDDDAPARHSLRPGSYITGTQRLRHRLRRHRRTGHQVLPALRRSHPAAKAAASRPARRAARRRNQRPDRRGRFRSPRQDLLA